MLKPAVLTDESKKGRSEENKFPVRPLILLPSEVEFLLSYLAKGDDDNKDVINYDNEEDRRLLEDNDDNNVSEIQSCIYLFICIYIHIHTYVFIYNVIYLYISICIYVYNNIYYMNPSK
jgi:hypothetical protein